MSADITAAAAASAAAATASAFMGAAFGLPLDTVCSGMVGSLLGLSLVKESPGSWRAAAQFLGYGIGAALAAAWMTKEAAGRDGLAFVFAMAGNPLARGVLAKAEDAGAKVWDRIFGAKQ